MEHGGEAARPTTLGSAQLGAAAARRLSFDAFEPGAVAYLNSAELARHVRAAAARREVPPVDAGFRFHSQPGPGVAYPNIGGFWRQPGPVGVVLVGPHLPDGVVPLHDYYGYAALQPRHGAGRGVALAALLSGGGAAYNGEYALQPRRDAGHGEVFVGLLPGGAGHGEALVEQLPGGDVAGADHYGYYAWQPRPGDAGRGEVFLGDGVGAVFVNSGNFAQQTPPATGRADGIAGALHRGAGHDGSGALAGAAYNNVGMVGAEHLRRLLPLAGIGACSVAVNGLAAGPGSPAVAFDLFAMFLGGLLLVIMHVLRV